jgi:multidrug transporter EmrE-like cation transporter
MGWTFLLIALVLNASANILMKLGASKLVAIKTTGIMEIIPKLITNYFLVFGLIFFALNVIFYIVALSKINLSVAYPIMTTGGFLIISLFSVLYLKEPLTFLQVSGIVLMAVGITLVAYRMG